MLKHYSHCTSIWENGEILHDARKSWQWKKLRFKFMFKCQQCHWCRHFWRKTVPGFCRRNTKRSVADCSETCLWYGKIRWWRKRCRPGISATCCRLSVRYVGARPFRHRNASTASLNDIRSGARSQCIRWSRGMIWSCWLALNTSRAAAFNSVPLARLSKLQNPFLKHLLDKDLCKNFFDFHIFFFGFQWQFYRTLIFPHES